MLTPLRETLKSTFNNLKEKGMFKDFENYEDWEMKKFGKVSVEEFKSTLKPKEKEQFEMMFDEK